MLDEDKEEVKAAIRLAEILSDFPTDYAMTIIGPLVTSHMLTKKRTKEQGLNLIKLLNISLIRNWKEVHKKIEEKTNVKNETN